MLGDTAYGNGPVRAELAERDVDALAPVPEGLSDVLCEVGVTDRARWARKGHPCPPRKWKSRGGASSRPALPESASEEVVDRLAGLLPEDVLQDALAGLRPEQITGPGGLMTQLAGRVLETALGAEMAEHLGYPPGQAPPGGAGNARNGSTPKRVHTELGTVEMRTPRDRNGTLRAAAGQEAPDAAGRP